MNTILTEKFQTPEVAAGIGHGNFSVFRRNYYADELNLLPPIKDANRGEYTFAQIVEMEVHLTAASTHTRHEAQLITWGILQALLDKAIQTPEGQKALFGKVTYANEIEAHSHCPNDLLPILHRPDVFLSGDIISRDPNSRSWALYHNFGAQSGKRAKVRILNEGSEDDTSLKGIKTALTEMVMEHVDDSRTRHAFEPFTFTPHLIDLTGLILRLEDGLRFARQTKAK